MQVDTERQTGRTTRQMLAAAIGSLYICVNLASARTYDRALAHKLNRKDLILTAPELLDRFLGLPYPAVIIDHAAELDQRQRETVDRITITTTGRRA